MLSNSSLGCFGRPTVGSLLLIGKSECHDDVGSTYSHFSRFTTILSILSYDLPCHVDTYDIRGILSQAITIFFSHFYLVSVTGPHPLFLCFTFRVQFGSVTPFVYIFVEMKYM